MPLKLTEFDASAYLDSEEVIAEYLTAALEDEDPDVFLTAVGNVAKARRVTQIAQATDLGRERLSDENGRTGVGEGAPSPGGGEDDGRGSG